MSELDSRSYIYYPTSLGELLQLYARKPRATLYAGGTFLLKGQYGSVITLPREVISLQHVEELKRIGRSERYVEIGSAVSVAQLLQVGGKVLGPVFRQALQSVAPAGISTLATVGGNLCVGQHALTMVPLAQLLDARLEVRHQGGGRWLPMGRFRNSEGMLAFRAGEMLTRIRMPTEAWDVGMFRKFGKLYQQNTHPLIVTAVAQTSRGTLDDLRLAVSGHTPAVVRSKELEAELVGRRIPLGNRETETFMRGITEMLDRRNMQLSSVQRRRAVGLIRGFLKSLIDKTG
jgi:CO/xanthine dehydrogenase FAD-binding subunit